MNCSSQSLEETLLQLSLENEKSVRIQESCVKLLLKWWTLHYSFGKASVSSEIDASLVSLLTSLPVLMRSKSTRVKTYRNAVDLRRRDVSAFLRSQMCAYSQETIRSVLLSNEVSEYNIHEILDCMNQKTANAEERKASRVQSIRAFREAAAKNMEEKSESGVMVICDDC